VEGVREWHGTADVSKGDKAHNKRGVSMTKQ
jgi:hypothetical protein